MSQAPGRTSVDLTKPAMYLKGCGPDRAARLARLGVHTVRDLLFFLPRDYLDLTDRRSIDRLEEGPVVSVVGTVVEVDQRQTGSGRSVVGVLLQQDSQYLRGLWFNQPLVRDRFRHGQTVIFSGKAKRRLNRWEMVHPVVRWLGESEPPPAGQLLPVYPLTEGLHQHHLRRLARTALDECVDSLDEVFPAEYLAQHSLLPLREALPAMHFPESHAALAAARRRLVYQELLVMQLALAWKRRRQQEASARELPLTSRIDARIRRLFPYELTLAQNEAIREITADLARSRPMNRLLQGDVGSGKTVVAVYAMLLAVAHGAQAALMAPTEILARQHYHTLSRLLSASQVRLGLLVGSLAAPARQQVLDEAAGGQVQILVGTQALVEADVRFHALGLVVIDEQHKFGVRQRAELRDSGLRPHYLVMTATPIPRTIAMTLFGDLEVSTLREGPPGRQNLHTYLPPAEDRPKWWEFFRRKLREGRQGYVIAPLVKDDDEAELASVAAAYEALANGELEAFRLGLVHGRLSGAEKEHVMAAFRRGELQVLMATSVVEVGVDVPNATLMTILGAQRFGLAQLHQMRGRVGRGSFPGFCCLFADELTADAERRLRALLETTDGFRLAEIDLEQRGPGDLFGTRQHGLPPLRVADLVRDAALVDEARRDAQALIAADPRLDQPGWALLKRMVLVRYGQTLDLADVG